jgi:protein-tyrosine phosphatase
MTMRARQFRTQDFRLFDLIVAMDHMNVRELLAWPGSVPEKVRLARSFDPSLGDGDRTALEVPDPYYGTPEDFESVADMLEGACRGILHELFPDRAATGADANP